MFNIVTEVETRDPGVKKHMYGVLYWKGTKDSIFVSGAHNYDLIKYGDLPCKNIATGEVCTADELMRMGYRRAGVHCEHALFSDKKYEYEGKTTFADILKEGGQPGTYVRKILLDSYHDVKCNDFILVFPFKEYKEYITARLPDVYKVIIDEGDKYIYHSHSGIWNINVCAIRTGIMVVSFGDGTYDDNDAKIEDYTFPYYKMHKEELIRVSDKSAVVHIVDYRKETFNGSSAG